MKARRSTKTEESAPTKSPEAGKKKRNGEESFPIVGIGASAGGLDSFERLLRQLPANTGMAFVFVQHLDPTRESRLTEILIRATTMTVVEAKERMRVKANTVYVIPPERDMLIKDRVLHLEPRRTSKGRHIPVDFFFLSLAASQKNQAIGVILSGTASDGTAGMKAIKAGGGITFAQDAASAKYSGMPQSAIAAGAVDFVLPPEEIARHLTRIRNHPYVQLPRAVEEEPSPGNEAESSIQQLFRLLKKSFGVDFSGYKFSTINRRIKRRMVLLATDHLEDYLRRVRDDPDELRRLFQDMFIGVTEFFRDPGMFEALAKTVYPAILKNRPADSPIRIWVPGCSTGEEVYSIAISLLEYMGNRASNTSIQIFGTDINEEAIKKARLGRYGKDIAPSMSGTRLHRFFAETDSGFQISKVVRDLCVFAKHDILRDPPFTRLDLLSCRNLLIYLSSDSQRKLIPVFHYALKPDGFLILGSAETIGEFSELFFVRDRKYRFYAKKATAYRPHLELPAERLPEVMPAEPTGKPPVLRSDFDLQKQAADQLILNHYGPPAVLVNDGMEILNFRGHTGPYLEPAPGIASLNLLKMAREGLLQGLRTSLYAARKKNTAVSTEGLRVEFDGREKLVDIHVVPIQTPGSKERTFLVMFDDATPSAAAAQKAMAPGGKAGRRADGDVRVAQLKQKLVATKAYLQSVIESREASNEELRSLNEEITSSNEELQSTTEELETANQELQSSNEELTTLNEELRDRSQELSHANNDILNLFNSMNLTTLLLDQDLRIQRFTPTAQSVLKLTPADLGRPITGIALPVVIPDLKRHIVEAMDSLKPLLAHVHGQDGRRYELQIRPYITAEDRVEGAVVALTDISELTERIADLDAVRRDLIQSKHAEKQLRTIVEAVPDAVIIYDPQGIIALVNSQAERMFGYSRQELIGQAVEILMTDRCREAHVAERKAFMRMPVVRPMGTGPEFYAQLKDGSELPVEVSLSPLETEDGVLVLSTIHDLTGRKHLAEQTRLATVLEERARMARDVHDTLAQGFTGIILNLEAIEAAAADLPEEVRTRVKRARDVARENLSEARRSILGLSSPLPVSGDLRSSIRELVDRYASSTKTRIEFAAQGPVLHLAPATKENLLRIAQQAIDNALQHARANTIRIELTTDEKEVRLRIQDDGQGFDVKKAGRAAGLTSMRERAKEIGGQFKLDSKPGKGTRVEVTVPLPHAQPPETFR